MSELLYDLVGWLLILAPLATVGGFLTAGLAALATWGIEGEGRTWFVRLAYAFPLLCLLWLIAVQETQNGVDDRLYHRASDVAPLTNGYGLQERGGVGILLDPGGSWHWSSDQDDIEGEVTRLQVSGPFIVGTYGFYDSSAGAERYFILDTRSGALIGIPREPAFRAALASHRIRPALEPVSEAFDHHVALFDRAMNGARWAVPLLGLLIGLGFAVALRWRRERS